MKVVMLTVHEGSSPRKVDFHFWTDVMARRKIHVDFVTVGFSPVTRLKKEGRKFAKPFNTWIELGPFVRKFLWCPPFHPFSLGKPVLDKISAYIFAWYHALMPAILLNGISDADLFIVENGAGLCLVPSLAKKFPRASFIYSVCDRIATLNYHPIILKAEKEALPYIDLIRVPAAVMVDDYPKGLNIRYIPHGLDKTLFDQTNPTPYTNGGKNIVSVGDMLFDAQAIEAMADAFPHCTFHLFGKNAFLKDYKPNVVRHGEQPFASIVPFIQHADVGLAPYRPAPNADYLSQSSMKMIQYTYCRLPIVAPAFAVSRDHMSGYEPGNKNSIVAALNRALSYDRQKIDNSAVLDWDRTVDEMFAGIERRKAA